MITSLLLVAALVALAIGGVLLAEHAAELRQQDQLRVALARDALADRERAEREVARLIRARVEKYDRAAEADRAARSRTLWIRERRV